MNLILLQGTSIKYTSYCDCNTALRTESELQIIT